MKLLARNSPDVEITSHFTSENSTAAASFLESALLFTFVIHLVAIGSTFLLLPGLPGGLNTLVSSRVEYISGHPWLWRFGWIPWQLTAFSDFLLSVALWRTPWIRKLPAALSLVATIAGIIPDQYGQAVWISRGIHLAQDAVASNTFASYAAFESSTFMLIAGFGTIGYLLGALGWTWCFATAGAWNRWLSRISVPLWSLFALAIVALFLPQAWRPPPSMVSLANAIAFALLMLWLVLVSERIWARSRPRAPAGRYARWQHPNRSLIGKLCNLIANSHFLRAIGECFPGFSLRSNVTDVIYINYLVEASRLVPLVPPGLELQRVGPNLDWSLFTCLTYRHGHLGPEWLGPFRGVLPSPIQSNWRIYVTSPSKGYDGVYFISTCINSIPHSLAARLLAEGMPMHIPKMAQLTHDSDDHISVILEPGFGTSPDLRATLESSSVKLMPKSWELSFPDYESLLAYCVPQDRALSCQPWYNRFTRQEISLSIPLETCVPLTGEVSSKTIQALVGDAVSVCFLVPKVDFRFLGEFHERL